MTSIDKIVESADVESERGEMSKKPSSERLASEMLTRKRKTPKNVKVDEKAIEEQRRRATIDTTMLQLGKKAHGLSVKHGLEREKKMIEEEQRRLNEL